MKTTKREIIFSVSIVAIMMILGIFISGVIRNQQLDTKETYNKSLKITSSEIFDYGMRTNVGNAFVYGTMTAVDPVSYPEIEGEYMYVKRVEEEYTKHEKKVYEYDDEGNETGYHYETYWTWDFVREDKKQSDQIYFLDIMFDYDKIKKPWSSYIDTISIGFNNRYVFYGLNSEYEGTIFTVLKDGSISDNSVFYMDKDITETLEYVTSDGGMILFWFIWVLLIVSLVILFYYIDNTWLETKGE